MTRADRQRRTFFLFLAAYLLALAVIALWPSPVDVAAAGIVRRVLDTLHGYGLPARIDYNVVEVLANVVLFVPFGFLLGGALPLRISWIALPVGMCTSLIIEVSHELVQPERLATLQDFLANSLGAAVGTVLSYAYGLRRLGLPLANSSPRGPSTRSGQPGPYA